MKTLPSGLAASLASGITTLCRCWLVTRTDGTMLGFTDHDEDVQLGSVTCSAASGFTATAIDQSLGLNVDGMEVLGALTASALNEDDLARGIFDNAAVEIWLVDWTDPAARVMLFAGSVGEVSRGQTAFSAEVRSLAHALNQPRGRLYQRTCDADLGDARCGVALSPAPAAVVAIASRRQFAVSGLDAYASAWFSRGRLLWTAGANAGASMEVRVHTRTAAAIILDLWEEMPLTVAVGDALTVTPGCDKTFATCRAKFGNGLNFRGFPHIPGNDYLTSYPLRGEGNDGGRRD